MGIRSVRALLCGLGVAVVGLLVIGCGVDDSAVPSATTGSPGANTTVESTISTTPPPTDAFDPAGYAATTVVTGLRIPWEMRFLPDGRLLVTEREGRVVIADVATGEVTEVGRIEVLVDGEGGLLGFALDPDFPSTPLIYVAYTTDRGGEARNRLSAFEMVDAAGEAPKLGSETVLVDDIPAGRVHNGSRVAFGPDGYLWMTTGDAGDDRLAQRMDSLAGKVLRMSASGLPAVDNPFTDRPYPFSLIYTLGHRNPQGLAFRPGSGQAFVTEHGPSENDEVNALQAGANYGWPDLRGKTGEQGYADPLITWTPTIAPAGALFCTETAPVGLRGSYVFVTLKQSDVRVLTPVDPAFAAVATEMILFDGAFGRLRAIAQGPDGALYVATSNHDGRGEPAPGDDRIIRIEAAK